jgi:hypothetical protein
MSIVSWYVWSLLERRGNAAHIVVAAYQDCPIYESQAG